MSLIDLTLVALYAVESKGYVHENYVRFPFLHTDREYELWKYFAQFRGEEGYSEGEIW